MSIKLIPIPRYQCHKVVGALHIIDIARVERGYLLFPEEEGFAPFEVPDEWYKKHQPQVGGYWVQYENGYTSYSPADAFKAGYTRIEE